MTTFFELLLNGILLDGVDALMACGLNLVFGVMRMINFAHGEFLAFGALPYGAALILVLLVMANSGDRRDVDEEMKC